MTEQERWDEKLKIDSDHAKEHGYEIRVDPKGGYPRIWGLTLDAFKALLNTASRWQAFLPSGRSCQYGGLDESPAAQAAPLPTPIVRSANDFGQPRGGRRTEDSDKT